MSEELKPCPFCGGKAVLLGGPQAQECHSVWCLDCSAKMQGGMQSEPLVEKWNARPAPAVQVPDELTFGKTDRQETSEYDCGFIDGFNACRDRVLAAPAPATANEEHF